ncbi:Detected protein of unknown function [Hibiscus syriacus]|uniref:Uncharacterized protein n=1 Tax=Hibiscus syriacus TaxID=106335 RepID=A0A6A2YJ59_HIBSY|nr:uncharacterized protein LOC120164849 [Hibiscus syriacus]KAE8677107.1 Detected protein of unknown function [Hibiscus syriacus]
MGWLFKESGRGGKQGWTQQTISSVLAPPLPLLSIFGIICLLLLLSSDINFKKEVHYTVLNLKLFLLFLPVILIFAAQFARKCERFVIPYARTKRELRRDLPWGMVVLLVMVSYQSYFHSMWSSNI